MLGALLLTSVVPLWLYYRQVLRISKEKLQDTERVQQTEITRSVAEETLQFETSIRQQLITQRQVMALTGWITDVDDPAHTPQLTRLLQNFIENNPDLLYVTVVNKGARGVSVQSFKADQDPFVDKALKRAFTASFQQLNSTSETFAVGPTIGPLS